MVVWPKGLFFFTCTHRGKGDILKIHPCFKGVNCAPPQVQSTLYCLLEEDKALVKTYKSFDAKLNLLAG